MYASPPISIITLSGGRGTYDLGLRACPLSSGIHGPTQHLNPEWQRSQDQEPQGTPPTGTLSFLESTLSFNEDMSLHPFKEGSS